MAHPGSKNLQKLSWPENKHRGLQGTSHYGPSIFSPVFPYTSYAPEAPALHYSTTVWTIHSFIYQYLLGTSCVHTQVLSVVSYLCPQSSLGLTCASFFPTPRGICCVLPVQQPSPLPLRSQHLSFAPGSHPAPPLKSQDCVWTDTNPGFRGELGTPARPLGSSDPPSRSDGLIQEWAQDLVKSKINFWIS